MKRIFVMNVKGGVGKTTIANEIAHSLDRTGTPYSYFDLDGQGGSSFEESINDEAQLQIADTPSAADGAEVAKWAKAADVIVIPVRPSMRDVDSFLETLQTAERVNPNAQIIIIQNMANRFTTARQFSEWLGRTTDKSVYAIPNSEAILQSTAQRVSIVETAGKRNKARAAVLEAVNAIRQAAGLEEEK